MRTWKLVSGILSIVLSVFVLFQSCAAGMVHTLAATGENGGSGGVIVAIMLLAGGIVSIVARNGSKGGHIALVVLFGIGAVCGYAMAGTVYQDLYIWATWCLVIAVLAVVSLLKAPKNTEKHRKKQPPVPSILRNRGLFFYYGCRVRSPSCTTQWASSRGSSFIPFCIQPITKPSPP